jgi:hypothetical protein
MVGQDPASIPRFPLQTIREMDRLARVFRRKLRDHVIRLSSNGDDASLADPEIVAEALRPACDELVSERAAVDERGADDQEPRAA